MMLLIVPCMVGFAHCRVGGVVYGIMHVIAWLPTLCNLLRACNVVASFVALLHRRAGSAPTANRKHQKQETALALYVQPEEKKTARFLSSLICIYIYIETDIQI